MDKSSSTTRAIKNIILYLLLAIWVLCTVGLVLYGIHWGVTEGYDKGNKYAQHQKFNHVETFLAVFGEIVVRCITAIMGAIIVGLLLPILAPLYGLYTYFGF